MSPPVIFMVTVTLTGASKPSTVAVAPLLVPLPGSTVPPVDSHVQSTFKFEETPEVLAVSPTGTPHQLSEAVRLTTGAGSTVTIMVS